MVTESFFGDTYLVSRRLLPKHIFPRASVLSFSLKSSALGDGQQALHIVLAVDFAKDG